MTIPINAIEIKELIERTVEKYLAERGLSNDGGTYEIRIRYVPPRRLVEVAVDTGIGQTKKEKVVLSVVDRPLEEAEWSVLYKLNFPEHLQKLLDCYANNRNQPMSHRDLYSKEINDPLNKISAFNTFLRKNKVPFGIRKAPGPDLRYTQEGNRFRIYPLATE